LTPSNKNLDIQYQKEERKDS